MNSSQPVPGQQAAFATTRWSLVMDAGHRGSPDGRAALASLCQAYWFPMYAFARRQGHNANDAMDVTQAFFADLLEKSWIDRADPQQGRFRTYLKTVFRRFMGDQHKRKTALKRGGGQRILSIDAATAEERYLREPATGETAERGFERQWALTLLAHVLEMLRHEYAQKDRADQFDVLQEYLTGVESRPYAEAAEQLSMSISNVKVAVHRLRQRYRQLLIAEVSQTVQSASDVDSELKALLAALSH